MEKTTKTDNELFAEFMGLVPCECNWCLPQRIKQNRDVFYSTPEKVSAKYPMHSEMISIDDAQYATSWDWLMPAWKKFVSLTPNNNAQYLEQYYDWRYIIGTAILYNSISDAHAMLVKGIKWHNENKE